MNLNTPGRATQRNTLFLILVPVIILLAWTILDLPQSDITLLVALLVAVFGATGYATYQAVQPASQHALARPTATSHQQAAENTALRQRIQDLIALRDVMLAMGATFDRTAILDELTNAITQLLHFDRGLVLLYDRDKKALVLGAFTHAAPTPESQFLLEQIQIDLADSASDPLLGRWQSGEPLLVSDVSPYLPSRLNWLLTTLDLRLFYSVPLMIRDKLTGVIVVDNTPTQLPISPEQRTSLDALATHIAITLENARLYQLTDEQLNAKVRELHILSRIDRELNHALSVDRVINLTLDWALRFTQSQAAAMALVDEQAQTMRFVAGYGFDLDEWEATASKSWPLTTSITGRVARTGQAEHVPDVAVDSTYFQINPDTRSQMSVPLVREHHVLGVISLESNQINGFTDANMEFVKRLTARAAVAIDNARLFDETRRERQKLELILSSTADAVVVVDHDNNLVLVNQAALAAFRLPPKERYAERPFDEVFRHTPLYGPYQRAITLRENAVEEMKLSDNRTMHVSLVQAPEVGWNIVMHDITPYKETEELKNELLSTTSHDLKNPLGSILGYIDLITMTNKLNNQGLAYVRRVQRAVAHMRQLIDDLLDMAKIESGIMLEMNTLSVLGLVRQTIDNLALQIKEKQLQVQVDLPADLTVQADESRLMQILANLIGNAIKYTPPEGEVWVRAEPREDLVHIAVQDNGMGISPEDQAQVWSRFFRVRTPETDSIEGTGLGLAIVKSLVEAHGGQVGLNSRLGEGSTFYFTLPTHPPAQNGTPDTTTADGAASPSTG
ncbi:MAG: GAF domain-containing protein [Chloroflexi bacterium]|nr:GAF domain-containing protein [Chloroflexota bacterium]